MNHHDKTLIELQQILGRNGIPIDLLKNKQARDDRDRQIQYASFKNIHVNIHLHGMDYFIVGGKEPIRVPIGDYAGVIKAATDIQRGR